MSVFAPDTDLRLVKCPLTYGDGHQLDFATAAAQATYFSGLPGKAYTDFSYQRKDHIIRIPDLAENIYPYNYVMYRNKASAKWFYAFITKIEFINQNCTHVHIRTDVFQTWMFDYTLKQCFIVREHTASDNYFEHTLEEGLATGDYVVNATEAITYGSINMKADTYALFKTNYYCCIVTSELLRFITDASPALNPYMSGTCNAAYFYAVDVDEFGTLMQAINTNGQISSVITAIAVPKNAATFTALSSQQFTTLGYLTGGTHGTFSTTRNLSSLNGYTPRNKKMFCYPYNFMRLRCGNQSIDLKYELLPNTTNQTFNARYMLSANPCYGVVPSSYCGSPYTDTYGVFLQDFPLVNYTYDVFKEYFALHTNSLALSTATGTIGFAFDLANGRWDSALNDISRSASAIAGFMDMKKIPDRIHGQISGQWSANNGLNGVYLEKVTIRAEYAQVIDRFFMLYGYKVERLDTPNTKSRTNHNYIEVRECNIEGDLPQDDIDELCAMYEKGLLIWHNPSTFGDVFAANNPVS